MKTDKEKLIDFYKWIDEYEVYHLKTTLYDDIHRYLESDWYKEFNNL